MSGSKRHKRGTKKYEYLEREELPIELHGSAEKPKMTERQSNILFASLAVGFGGWMTFVTYVTYAACGWVETAVTRDNQRRGSIRDYFMISLLAMGGAYLTNWALTYLNYATRIVFKSCRVLPVMGFRTLVVGQRYTLAQYGAGVMLVAGIALFTSGDAAGVPNFASTGIVLISVALMCDAMTANLEEKKFFRIETPCSHSEVMLYLSLFAAAESFCVIVASGEIWEAIAHSQRHTQTVPYICAFSVLGYITVCLILLLIKNYGSTNAEVVKSLRKVFQVTLSFVVFPKPMSYKYILGGLLVALSLYCLNKFGAKKQPSSVIPDSSADPSSPSVQSGKRFVTSRSEMPSRGLVLSLVLFATICRTVKPRALHSDIPHVSKCNLCRVCDRKPSQAHRRLRNIDRLNGDGLQERPADPADRLIQLTGR
eukprot:gene2985-12993_t